MDNIEQAFQDVESAANSTSKASNDLTRLANQMKKAAIDGNINGIRRASERMNDLLGAVRQEVANAVAGWSYREEEEEQYLKDHYADELTKAANISGLTIHKRDGQLISHPSIIRVLPGEKSVRIDRKKVSAIRPSRLIEILVENQKKKPRFSPERFLEAIYKAYMLLAEKMVPRSRSKTVKLERSFYWSISTTFSPLCPVVTGNMTKQISRVISTF